jgi:hypothetical protein
VIHILPAPAWDDDNKSLGLQSCTNAWGYAHPLMFQGRTHATAQTVMPRLPEVEQCVLVASAAPVAK